MMKLVVSTIKTIIINQQQHQNDDDTDNNTEDINTTYIDIAIFEVPNDCNSQKCDLTEYGVGILEHYDGIRFLNFCSPEGRLNINKDKFIGHHVELPVPTNGPMITDHVNLDDSEIYIANAGRTFEVMIANCNKQQGREINLYGQVVFDSIGLASNSEQDAAIVTTEIHLMLFALAICVLFTLCSIRVNMGTRAQYTYDRLAHNSNNRRIITSSTEQAVGREGEEEDDDDDANSIVLHPIQIV